MENPHSNAAGASVLNLAADTETHSIPQLCPSSLDRLGPLARVSAEQGQSPDTLDQIARCFIEAAHELRREMMEVAGHA